MIKKSTKKNIEDANYDTTKDCTRPGQSPKQLNIPESGARLSAGISDHMGGEHAHKTTTTTRIGRKVKIPARYLETVENNTTESKSMRVQCKICGQEYANHRNLRRHLNSCHNDTVKFVRCPVSGCDRIFFRKEYLQIHLERSHGASRGVAREDSRCVHISYTDRRNIETIGQERRLRPQPAAQPLQDLHVHVPEGPNAERVVEAAANNEDVLSLDSDTGEYDMEVGEIEKQNEPASSSEEESVPIGDKPQVHRRADQVPDFDGEVPGPSGVGASGASGTSSTGQSTPKEVNASNDGSVEVISLSLITVRSTRDGQPHCHREHKYQTTVGIDPRAFDWRGFVEYMVSELFEHASYVRRQQSNVTVSEMEDDEEEKEDKEKKDGKRK